MVLPSSGLEIITKPKPPTQRPAYKVGDLVVIRVDGRRGQVLWVEAKDQGTGQQDWQYKVFVGHEAVASPAGVKLYSILDLWGYMLQPYAVSSPAPVGAQPCYRVRPRYRFFRR